MPSPRPDAITLDDILITEELSRRSPRPPNWQAESEALRSLTRQLVHDPEVMLQSLVDWAVELGDRRPVTAGVSLVETNSEGEDVFRWVALSGTLADRVGGCTPRHFSPCWVCLEREAPVLFSYPERYFTYFQEANTPLVEGLVLPLMAEGQALGTIWIITHTEGQPFDGEDVRLMTGLADFTAATLLRDQRAQESLKTKAQLATETGDRKRLEAQALALIENLPGGAVFIVDRDLRYQLAAGEALSVARFEPEDFVGRTIFEVLPPELAASYEPMYRSALAGKSFEHEHQTHDRWYISRGTPLRTEDGEIYAALAVSYDITQRKRAEAAIAADLRDTHLLHRLAMQVGLDSQGQELYQPILEAAIALMHADMGSLQILDVEHNTLRLQVWKGFHPEAVAHWQTVGVDDGSVCGAALRRGERVIVADLEACDLALSTADREAFNLCGIQAVQSTPLLSRSGQLIGMFSTQWCEPYHPNERELRFLDLLARQAADLIEQRQAEAVLSQSEAQLRRVAERDAFRLKLSDALRSLADPVDIEQTVTQAAMEHFGADRCYYCKIENGEAIIRRDAARDGLPSVAGVYPLSSFAILQAVIEAGQPFVVQDVRTTDKVDEDLRQICLQLQVISFIDVPVIKQGKPVGVLCLVQSTPRDWTDLEVELTVETAERTWAAVERTRAEVALRKSEEKYRVLFNSIDESFALIELIYGASGKPVDLLYVETNPTFERQIGVSGTGKKVSELVEQVEESWLETYARILQTGQPERFEHHVKDSGKYYSVFAARVGGEGSRSVAAVFDDITERKQAEEASRKREEQQAFLLKFSDALRAESDADAIASRAVRMLAEHLHLDRCWLSEVFEQQGISTVGPEYHRPDLLPMSGVFRLADYPETMRQLVTQPMVISDATNDPHFADAEKALLDQLHLRALLVMPLRQGHHQVIWAMAAAMTTPRHWSESERMLLEQVGERTWAAVERARAEAALREREARLSDVLGAMNEGFALFDREFRIVDVNRETLRLDGRSREQLIGCIHWEAFPGTEGSPLGDLFQRVMQERTAGSLEHQYVWPDGRDMWIDARVFPTYDGGVAVFWRDITERKRDEEKLRKSEERFRTVSDLVPDLLWRSDTTGDTTWLNQRWLDYTGQTLEAAVEWGWIEAIHPDDRQRSADNYRRAAATGHQLEQEHRIRRHDGTFRWFIVRAEPICDEAGVVQHWFGSATDIHDQRLATEALRASEEKYRSLFTSIDEGFTLLEMMVDESGQPSDFRIVETNPAWEQQTGLTDAVGKTLLEIAPNFEQPLLDFYRDVVMSGRGRRIEYYTASVDRWYTVYVSRVGGEGSRQVAAVFDDISDRKRNQERQAFLLKLSDILQQFVQPNDLKAVAMGLLGEHLGVSRAQYHECDSSGEYYTADGIGYANGLPLLDLKYRIDDFGTFVNEDFAAGRPYRIDDLEVSPRISAAEREAYRSYQIRAGAGVPLIRGGKLVAILSVHDVHPHPWTDLEMELIRETAERIWTPLERARAEAALRESEQRLSVIFAQAAVGLSEISLDGRFEQVNDALCQMLGRSRQDLLATTVPEVTHPEDIPASLDALAHLLETGTSISLDKRYLRADGICLWANSILTLLHDEQGQPRHILAVTVDLSDRKQAEAARDQLIGEQAARFEAEQASRLKDEFLSMVSHELQSPLVAILGWTRMLRANPPTPGELAKKLGIIERNATLQAKLIQDLLDISRIAVNKLSVTLQPIALETVVESAIASVIHLAEAKGIRLVGLEPSSSAEPVWVMGDRDRLQQILYNLLTNAIKFTPPEGRINVTLVVRDGVPDSTAEIRVIDTGLGIAAEFLPHVFDRFRQAEVSGSAQGLGLGLAIARHLMERHHGTLRADSDGLGKGATFTATLPLLEGHNQGCEAGPSSAQF